MEGGWEGRRGGGEGGGEEGDAGLHQTLVTGGYGELRGPGSRPPDYIPSCKVAVREGMTREGGGGEEGREGGRGYLTM